MVMLNVDGGNEDQEDFDNTIQPKKEDAFEFMTVGNMEQYTWINNMTIIHNLIYLDLTDSSSEIETIEIPYEPGNIKRKIELSFNI